MYLPFTSLDLGFANAENYQRRENKELLSKYFVRDDFLDRLLDPNVFFLVGEKGTGKTAYATFLRNTEYKGHKVAIFDVMQTEYQKFLELKKRGHLALSQFTEVWATLLLMATATTILSASGTPEFLRRFTKLAALQKAINEFFENAFAPEIVKMLTFVESAEVASSLIAKHMDSGADVTSKTRRETQDSKTVFQVHLLRIRHAFEVALKGLKLDDDVLIFIDGIDIRPGDIAYADYFECVRGLIDAIWALNNGVLANIKDSPGRIRIVLLVRPDIFLRTGLHNINTKLRDNSVFLNWMTTYKDYRSSLLFKVADRLLSAQQSFPVLQVGNSWDYYFPFHAENVKARDASDTSVSSFLAFLRFGYYRPRDINSMMRTLQEFVVKKRGTAQYVTAEDFNDPSFRDAHAEYLLGEIRDQLLFYYSQDEYDLFLQFFPYLRGKRKFSYDEFTEAFNEFIEECSSARKQLPQFFESAPTFLQFLFEQNVISYVERDASADGDREVFIRWCFRERTLSNMAPKVRVGVNYEIFYGLSKALNVGRVVRVTKSAGRRDVGTVIVVEEDKGFGFIRGGEKQTEYYFKLSEFRGGIGGGKSRVPRIGQKVSFEVQIKYAKPRARTVMPER